MWDCDKLSLDSHSSNNERENTIEEDGKEKGICKDLKDDEKKILLNDNKRILKLV